MAKFFYLDTPPHPHQHKKEHSLTDRQKQPFKVDLFNNKKKLRDF